jgi:hypothetical protein
MYAETLKIGTEPHSLRNGIFWLTPWEVFIREELCMWRVNEMTGSAEDTACLDLDNAS